MLPMIFVKLIAWQLFRALGHIHDKRILHRDVKPQNILIDTETYTIKLCDFGSAKKMSKDEASVSYICSRYYRAPELIFGATKYTNKIDVWAAACVVAELIRLRPLFPGKSGKTQINEIFRVIGTPSSYEVASMNKDYRNRTFPAFTPLPLETNFPPFTEKAAISFLQMCLVYDPSARPSALEALGHPFFDELKKDRKLLPNGQ